MTGPATCIECGDALPDERAELGYRYCTRDRCQAVNHRGTVVTAVGNNKSADTLIVADPEEIARRGEAGEFARKDTGLGLGYRAPAGVPRPRTAPEPTPRPITASPRRAVAAPRRQWSAQQEKVVRLYHDMGLSPAQIAARAGQNNPRLVISERLAVQMLSAPPPRT